MIWVSSLCLVKFASFSIKQLEDSCLQSLMSPEVTSAQDILERALHISTIKYFQSSVYYYLLCVEWGHHKADLNVLTRPLHILSVSEALELYFCFLQTLAVQPQCIHLWKARKGRVTTEGSETKSKGEGRGRLIAGQSVSWQGSPFPVGGMGCWECFRSPLLISLLCSCREVAV